MKKENFLKLDAKAKGAACQACQRQHADSGA